MKPLFIKAPEKQKQKKKTITNKKVQCSISKNIFKAKRDLRTVSFFQKKLCKEKNTVLFDFSLICYDFFCQVFWEFDSCHKNI